MRKREYRTQRVNNIWYAQWRFISKRGNKKWYSFTRRLLADPSYRYPIEYDTREAAEADITECIESRKKMQNPEIEIQAYEKD